MHAVRVTVSVLDVRRSAWPGELLRWVVALALIGALTGAACAGFLVALAWAQTTRTGWPWLILGLPVAGWIMGWYYQRYGAAIAGGTDQVITEAQAPQTRLPLRMAPMIVLATVATHLFGGSAGREGTAVQMGAALADQLGRWSRWAQRERRFLLMAGMSAGFGALFGTPWAGAIFAMEVLVSGRLVIRAAVPCIATAWLGNAVVLALGVPHAHYAVAIIPNLDWAMLGWVLVTGLLFGLAARAFVVTQENIRHLAVRFLPQLKWRALVGGLIVLSVVAVIGVTCGTMAGATRYLGLGIPLIHEAQESVLPLPDCLLKMLLTAITLAFGFKGGEVTPLFVIGATLGSALSLWIPLPVDLLAALGLVAVFAAAANVPLACTVMAGELFGPEIFVYAALVCAVAYTVSGHPGIYRTQKLGTRKWLP